MAASGLFARLCGAVLLSVLLAGCGGTAGQRALVLERAGGPREAMAREGIKRLREAFNRGACQSIFDEADLSFRLRQSRQAWLDKCADLRRKLGMWRSFEAHVAQSRGVPLSIVLDGEAEFAGGRASVHEKVQTVWHFDHGRAELFSMHLNGEAIPSYSWPVNPRKRYLDPPAERGSE